MQKLNLLLMATAFSVAAVSVARASAAGAVGADFLNIPLGGRPAALGGAYSALATDVYAPVWNPGGLSSLSNTQVAASHVSYLQAMSYEFLGFAQPMGTTQGWGAAVQYFRSGDTRSTDELGNDIGNYSGAFESAAAGYGVRAGRVGVGAALKYVRERIADDSAGALAIDAGAHFKRNDRWAFGAAVSNLGSKLKFIEKADSLPLNLRAGTAWHPLRAWTFAVDGVLPKSDPLGVQAGVEWSPLTPLSFRLGFRSQNARELSGIAGFTAGMGLHWNGQEFDYSWIDMNDLGNTQYFSVVLSRL